MAIIRTSAAWMLCFLSFTLHAQTNFHYKWGKHHSGKGQERAGVVKLDHDGNVIAAGSWSTEIKLGDNSGITHKDTLNGGSNSYLVKYNHYGDPTWSRMLSDGRATTDIKEIETDRHGNIYVVALFNGKVDLEPGPGKTHWLTSTSSKGYALIKLDPKGQFLWAVPLEVGNTSDITHGDLEIDKDGYAYWTAAFQYRIDFDPSSNKEEIFGSSSSIFIAKYDPKGNLAKVHYTYHPGAFDSKPTAMALDDDKNVYLVGQLKTNSFYVDGYDRTFKKLIRSGADIFLIKLDSLLKPKRWFSMGYNNREGAMDIAVNGDQVFVAGYYEDSIDVDVRDTHRLTLIDPPYLGTNSSETFIARYDKNFKIQSAKTFESFDAYPMNLEVLENKDLLLLFKGTRQVKFNPGINNYTGDFGISNYTRLGMARMDSLGVVYDYALYKDAVFYDSERFSSSIDRYGNLAFNMSFFQKQNFHPTGGTVNVTPVDNYEAYTMLLSDCRLSGADVMTDLSSFSCTDDSIKVSINPKYHLSGTWYNGSTASHAYQHRTDTFVVKASKRCEYYYYVELPEDTVIIKADTNVICGTDSLLLKASSGFDQYQWNGKQLGRKVYVKNSGQYTVTASNTCGNFSSAPFEVIKHDSLKTISIAADTNTFCAGDSLLLKVVGKDSLDFVLWSDSSQTDSIYVFQDTAYHVAVWNNCFSGTDSFDVLRIDSIKYARIAVVDALICPFDTVEFMTSPTGHDTLWWSDGTSQSTYKTSDSGWHYLTVKNRCFVTIDSAHLKYHDTLPDFSIDAEADSICAGEFLLLTLVGANGFWSQWTTGAYPNTIIISDSGWYGVRVENQCYSGKDSIYIPLKICPSSLLENNLVGIRCYPNPAIDQLVIELPVSSGRETLSLFDLNGRLMLQTRLNGIINEIQLDEDIENGLYQALIQGPKGRYVQKISVMR